MNRPLITRFVPGLLLAGAALLPALAQNPFDAETTSRHAGHYTDGQVELEPASLT